MDPQNPSDYGSNRPTGQPTGPPQLGSRPPVVGGQWKPPPFPSPGMRVPTPQVPGVNGFPTPHTGNTQRHPNGPHTLRNTFVPNSRSEMPFMNGPNVSSHDDGNQQWPRIPPHPGQFRPPVTGMVPPDSGVSPLTGSSGLPPGQGGPFTPPQAPPMRPPMAPQGQLHPSPQGLAPVSQTQPGTPPQPAQSQVERPNELPIPYQGHGQYSHQVGLSLTPGITPANSGPPSQKSSRTNSPAVNSQTFDALEGQFRNTPDQETGSNTPPVPSTQAMPPQTGPGTSAGPGMSMSHPGQTAPGTNTTGPGMSMSHPGQTGPATNTGPGMSMSHSAPTGPGANIGPGMSISNPGQSRQGASTGPGMSMSHPGQQSTTSSTIASQLPGFTRPPSMSGPHGNFPTGPGFQPRFPMSSAPGPMPTFPVSSAAGQPAAFQSTPANPISRFSAPVSTVPNQQPGFPPTSLPNQRPGFPPMASSANQVSGFPPMSTPIQRPGFPPPVSTQQPAFPLPPTTANQQPGFQPPPTSAIQQPGFPPPMSNQQPGFPSTMSNQQPGFPPQPMSNQQPGFPPPVSNQQPGFPPQPVPHSQPGFQPPPPASSSQQPGFPPPPMSGSQQQTFPGQVPQQPPTGFPAGNQTPGKSIQQFVNTFPTSPDALTSNMSNMSIQQGSQGVTFLLQQKQLIPPDGVDLPKPNIPNDFKNVNCNPDIFRCTLNAIPQTSALLSKARLPLGILIHPFKDLSQLPVIQSSVIVRCRSCRTYINPFVYFVDSRRWKCNLCFRANELPDEFSFDPVTKTYGDPQRRPEIRSATIEFIAPSEYMLRPPQPAVYLYLLDVSFNALETGYLNVFCETLLDVLDKIPGDARTHIGFVAYDSAIHFFNLAEGLSQPQMLTVSDVDDIFLPYPDNLLVNLNESKDLVIDLLNQLPGLFEGNMETGSALGAALQAAAKMTTSTGGRITVMQTILPTVGPGALHNREDGANKSAKDVQNLGPATDFYKKLALDCSAQQIAVDLFLFNGQYADLATIECISRYSAGCVQYYPSYHAVRTPHLAEKFEVDLRRYLTRKIGFESVMRIRCSKGMSIHTFHGNFFVRSTDLLSLPNINPDAGFGMQMSIEEALTDMTTMCFQAALLYTSSKGERRIRVHTLCLPITNQISEVYASADQQAIAALLAKMAVDRCTTTSMSDAREAIVNAAIDTLNAFGSTLTSAQRMGSLCISDTLRLLPLYCLALLKSNAFRMNPTRLDDRVYALSACKNLPVSNLLQTIYPDLYPLHTIMDVDVVKKGHLEVPKLPLLQLSSANIDKFGAYLLDTGDRMFLYLGSAVSDQFCQDILDKPNFAAVHEGGMSELPELDNPGSERLRSFVTCLLDSRPNGVSFIMAREDGKFRMKFFEHFVEDRTESSFSYHEFLQSIQKQVKS